MYTIVSLLWITLNYIITEQNKDQLFFGLSFVYKFESMSSVSFGKSTWWLHPQCYLAYVSSMDDGQLSAISCLESGL